MTKKVVVYSKAGCGQCLFTKKHLNKMNVDFLEKDINKNPQWLDEVRELGFQSLPVIHIEGEKPFNGFQPERLNTI